MSDLERQAHNILSADLETLTEAERAWRQAFDDMAQHYADEIDRQCLDRLCRAFNISPPKPEK